MISLDKIKLTGEQIRGARAMLRISAKELADTAGIGVATVRRSEAEDGVISANYSSSKAMQDALEHAGIEFISAEGGGVGVRLKEG
ncbi:MAG: transcriptional regulator [Sulfitobacter sp.]|nr:transcriptional regulator [Sulfitobacter sp.]